MVYLPLWSHESEKVRGNTCSRKLRCEAVQSGNIPNQVVYCEENCHSVVAWVQQDVQTWHHHVVCFCLSFPVQRLLRCWSRSLPYNGYVIA